MADKQCFVYIVDQGQAMADVNGDRDENDLEFGMRYIWDKIAITMAAARKTWTVGVLGLKTDATKNPLGEDDESYAHISVQKEIGPFGMSDLKALQGEIRPSKVNTGDAISSIIVAIDMIETFTKKLKYHRKIVLMTNGRTSMDADGLGEVAKKLNAENIELVVLGIDFDDADYGFKEEDKDSLKSSNEALLKTLVDQCDRGTFGTVAEAVSGLGIPVVKESRPYATYKGILTLGDPENYQTAMCIDVERYFRTKKAAAISASTFAARTDIANDEASKASKKAGGSDDVDMGDIQDFAGDLAAVKQSRTYKVEDPSYPGGRRDVEREELAKGFEYGRTAVPISESEENVTKLETVETFSIIGFIPRENYERFFNMGESCVTIAQKTNEKAQLALSSLIHGLFELETCAVARIVKKDGKDPELILLFPSIEPDLECLIDVPLPFAEDVRTYRFPPLDRVVTITGTVLTKHRNIPTDALSNAMSAFVDSMDLSTAGEDDEGNAAEYMPIEEIYAPSVHRLNQAVRRRAVKPDEPVGPPADILTRFSEPPKELVKESKSLLAELIATADVKKVPPKTKGKRGRDYVKPLSGLDVDALLNSPAQKRVKISVENAVPEYKQMLATADNLDAIKEATKQMAKATETLIHNSTGNSKYEQALANITVMRRELIDLEEPKVFNTFILDLKQKLLAGSLGGDRREFMFEVRKMKLGLVGMDDSELSEVTAEEAAEFYSLKADLPVREK